MPNEPLFYLLAVIALLSAVAATYFRRPIDSAFSFLITLLSLAALFALLNQSFLFAAQIIIYAGAILTLILFIIMFLNINEQHLPHEPERLRNYLIAAILTLPFCGALIYLIANAPLQHERSDKLDGRIEFIGTALFSDYLIAFELISILLLTALVGAIILAFNERNTTLQEKH